MRSAFVLSFSAMLLVGGLCWEMADWTRFPRHDMRRDVTSCYKCLRLSPDDNLDGFRTVSDGQARCKSIQPFVDCIKGDSECSDLIRAAHMYETICSDIEGMVAASQCFGGDAGFHRSLEECIDSVAMASKRRQAEAQPVEQHADESPDCRSFTTEVECIIAKALQCSPSAGRVLKSVLDVAIEEEGCA